MNKAGKLNRKTVQLTELALLTALLMVLTIFNIGFINYGVISITILHIPVIIGSILMGPYYGGILGLIFGVLSMLNATFRGVTPVDLMFSPFASGLPLQSIVMSVVPRVLLGVIPALLYRLLHKKQAGCDRHFSSSCIAATHGRRAGLPVIYVFSGDECRDGV